MVITWDDISRHLDLVATNSSFAAVVVGGGLSLYKGWLISEEEASKKVLFLKQILITRLGEAHRNVLNGQIRQFLNAEVLESDSSPIIESKIDPIDAYSELVTKVISKCRKFDELHSSIRSNYHYILMTAVAGLPAVVLSWLFEDLRPFIAIFAGCLILIQVCAILAIRKAVAELVSNEHAL